MTTYDKKMFKDFSEEEGDKSAEKKGLSITKNGRLVFTVGLQQILNLEPSKRNLDIYIQVLYLNEDQKSKSFIYFLQFFTEETKIAQAKYKLYRPDFLIENRTSNNHSSYLEFARFLKERKLIASVKEASQKLTSGKVDILQMKVEPDETSIVISLKDRFK